jgi:membrane fusion protein (multidrug efflux system)
VTSEASNNRGTSRSEGTSASGPDSDEEITLARATTEHPGPAHLPQESLTGSGTKKPTRRRKLVRALIVAAGLFVLLGGLVAVKASQIKMLIGFGEQMQKAGPPPEVVGTAVAESQDWEGTLSAVASVVSSKGVDLSNDSPGIVTKLHFESGDIVKKGEVIVELDTNVERAQLISTKARRDLALTELMRSQALVASGAISQAQADADEATYKSLAADAAALEAQIARKVIRAPFAGKLGIREVNLGQYLAPGTRVAVLESTDAVFADFTLPQRYLGNLKTGMTIRAYEGEATEPLVEGTISAIDPAIDPVTRNIKVRATLPNEAEKLRPGMFLRVEVVLPEQGKVVAVPLTAVVRASYGDSLFRVEDGKGPDGTPRKVARQQFVKLGEARGDFVAILEGLKAGQEVVTSGAFKLRNGAFVVVDNTVKPKPELSPRPENQ